MSEFARELSELVGNLARDGGGSHWRQVCDLGLAGIGIPEEQGGSGGSLADLMVVVGELARVGIGTPIVEASTAAYALGEPPADRFDTIVVDQDLIVPNGALTTRFAQVPFADAARRLVIVTASSVATVPLRQEGVTVESRLDVGGLPDGSVHLENATVTYVSAARAATKVHDRLTLARTASLIGTARGAYGLTRSYLTERRQFGAPLVKIPAVANALARMAVQIRLAQSAFDRAVSRCGATDTHSTQRSGAVAAARITAADTATLVARSAHQLHGAVGFTDEYGLHRYTTKLWAWRDADESQRIQSARLGARVRVQGEDELWQWISA